MTEDRLLFIVNPHSGRGKIGESLLEIIDLMCKAHFTVTVYTSQSQGDAEVYAYERAKEYDRIVCSGGDGTLDEVISGLMRAGIKRPIGYIPAGTSNDFASSLGLGNDMLANADTAVHGRPFACDIGRFNDGYFVYVAAFGVFTEVSYSTSQELKNVFGHAAYVLEGIRQLSDISSYRLRVEFESGVIQGDFIYGMVTNSVSIGGFRGLIHAPVDLDDGEFEVTLVRRPHNPMELNEIIAYLLGIRKESRMIEAIKCAKVRFRSIEPIAWTLDGEFGGMLSRVEIKNIPQALELMVNQLD